jgi:hypothetical protein
MPIKKMTSKQRTTISTIFEQTVIIFEVVEDVGFICSVRNVLFYIERYILWVTD